ncbi:Leucine-rich repeat-containing G-protein coupled receptor 5 [Holothuria leucospilota]|uniref:Leucine-rich repeat-containing G-protein coupled receptor 5 n=1 Tax=Holothuria leucospilota TaxID=206669 RepID=A0A9Q1BMT9_HOLLE|nr:Leucine-rich repeat-containing G-protein coupled receptor 5 [Holothuria leucospilota]
MMSAGEQEKLSYNIISKSFELPDSIRGVNLQNNKLKDVGEMFRGKQKLTELDFLWNPLISIAPNAFDDLCALTQLTFGGNDDGKAQIRSFPSGLFQKCGKNLFEMTIQNTHWQRIEDHSFHGVSESVSLDLSQNLIQSVGKDAFAGITSLIYLDLSDNNLQYLPDNLLKGQTNLLALLFQRNPIKTITANVFADLTSLRSLHMYVNPIEVIENEALQHLRENSTIHCISDSLAVPIEVPDKLKDAFSHDGFDCDNEHDGIFQCRACPVGTYGNRVHHGCVNCPAGKKW